MPEMFVLEYWKSTIIQIFGNSTIKRANVTRWNDEQMNETNGKLSEATNEIKRPIIRFTFPIRMLFHLCGCVCVCESVDAIAEYLLTPHKLP